MSSALCPFIGCGCLLRLDAETYQSGELDRDGSVSKCGDALTRSYLFEAAGTRLGSADGLRSKRGARAWLAG
ncbi:transposase [Mesorhizobium sp. L48C026A00]|uniref:transposase n=1 Tax=Mesorhizobium sp. L48C026A00 TaxID=1287182 RepID=UPI001FD9D0A9|nr:transposase [Mesorhizobium sp. L48C026A00]